MNRQIFTNTIYQVTSKAMGVIFSLLLTYTTSKYLGIIQFGELIKTISFVSLFYTPLDFGLNAIALKLYAQKPTQKNHTVSQLNLIRLTVATILIIVIFTIVALLPSETQNGYTNLVKKSITILSFTLYVQALIRTTNSIFQHKLKYKYTVATEVIQNIVVLLATIVAINTTKNIIPVAIGYLVGGAIAVTIQYYFVKKYVEIKIVKPDYKLIKKILTNSLPLGIIIIISAVHTKTDILLMTVLKSTFDVGIYGLVKRIFETTLTIPLFFSNSLYPVLLTQQNNKLLTKSVIVMFFTSNIVMVLLLLASPLLVYIKPEFSNAIPLLKLTSLTLPLFFTSAPLMWWLISQGRQNTLIGIYFQALIINTILCLMLIPTYGAIGGIIALAVSELTTLICLLYFTLRNHESNKQ